jgi:tetratricopeptide (TPR) repeat protein
MDGMGDGGGAWHLAPEVRGAVLLAEARRVAAEGDPLLGMAYAEEALDHDPADVEALVLLADVAARAGFAEVGILAAVHARALGGDPGAAEAAARFAACQVDGALAAAEQVLATRPADARAHAVRGQCLAALGRDRDADDALAEAHRLDPARFARGLIVDLARWPAIVRAARRALPPDERKELKGVAIEILDRPDLAVLKALDPPASPAIPALMDRDGRKYRLAVFRDNLCRGALDEREIVQRLAGAMRDELAAWSGARG